MKNNINNISFNQCSGCALCAEVCPKSCITYIKASNGFLYPNIDENTCVSCGKCVSSCPVVSNILNETSEKVFASYSSSIDHNKEGSSGGVFGEIARLILSKDGIVYGAAFDNNLKLRHIRVDSIENLQPLFKSKYIQSDISGIYKQVKNDIQNGVLVLFCGTPCQCSALKNYLKDSPRNLILVDFVCHGVPSQDLFDKSIAYFESTRGVVVKNFIFRYKSKTIKHPQSYAIFYEHNDKERWSEGLHYQFPYYFGFQKYLTLRPSCYECNYAKPERCSDITLGDFWGIEKHDATLKSKKGVSMLLPNTGKGKLIIENLIRLGMINAKSFLSYVAFNNNACLQFPTRKPSSYKLFFEALATKPFVDVVNTYLTPRRKWIFDIYYAVPTSVRNRLGNLLDKFKHYE